MAPGDLPFDPREIESEEKLCDMFRRFAVDRWIDGDDRPLNAESLTEVAKEMDRRGIGHRCGEIIKEVRRRRNDDAADGDE